MKLSVSIKPEIYASWIPMGQIGLKPLIFASYIFSPHEEKVSADTNRGISRSEENCADTLRRVGEGERIAADILSTVTKSERITVDATRRVAIGEKISGDTNRYITETNVPHADTDRQVKKTERVIFDTSRKIGLISVRADTQRLVISSEKNIFDTNRRIGIDDKTTGDLYLRLVRTQIGSVDTYRRITETVELRFDTFRQLGIGEATQADTSRSIISSERVPADTWLQFTEQAQIIGDTARIFLQSVRADCLRQVVRPEKVVASTVIRVPHLLRYIIQPPALRTKSRAKSLLSVEPSLVNTFKDYGVTAINITLSERTLSDNFQFDIARTMDINEAVIGTLLDYPFSFLVEETSQADFVQSVTGRYSVDELLYTQIFIPSIIIKTENYTTELVGNYWAQAADEGNIYCYPRATEIMQQVANALGLALDIKIGDFTPNNLTADHRVTYADIVSTVFSWTSRLPQRQVNVFIRGGVLHCIQRGMEENVFDITDLPISRPTVQRKLVRSLWSNPRADDDVSEYSSSGGYNAGSNVNVEYMFDEYQTPFSGTISFSGNGFSTELSYSNGLLTQEVQGHEDAASKFSSTTTYQYREMFPTDKSQLSIAISKALNKNFYGDFYLASRKNSSSTDKSEGSDSADQIRQTTTTTYNYARTEGDEVYLVSEIEETVTRSYENGQSMGTSEDYRETYHVPLGNGWYGQSVYRNGECQGSNISQGKPGNRVSQYMTGEVQKAFVGWKITTVKSYNGNTDSGSGSSSSSSDTYDDWRKKLSPIADTSFPVREFELLSELTSELLWLNRKVAETITVEVISPVVNGVPSISHIVDFTERVKFNDAEYFLVSNSISFTPRKLIQRLQLIRWY